MSVESIDFKIIGIKPRAGCSKKYFKNLKPNNIYCFYSNYKVVVNERNEPMDINFDGTMQSIFNSYTHSESDLHINISAVVGRNGSGKSTLTEILFFGSYLTAWKKKLLNGNNTNMDLVRAEYKVDIYYSINNTYYCIVFDNLFFPSKRPTTSNINFIDFWRVEPEDFNLQYFFYTIAGNYSLYGLNQTLMGNWIGELFHKNDGYQTPVVINPFRDKGNINVLGELHFAQTRLLSNLMLNRDSKVEILPNKEVKKIFFLIDREKIGKINGYSLNYIHGRKKKSVFKSAYEILLGLSFSPNTMQDKHWESLTIDYVFGKLIRIAMNYKEYNRYFRIEAVSKKPMLLYIDEYLRALREDRTHITLKLRQALNFYRFDILRIDENEGVYKLGDSQIFIPLSIFNKRIKTLMAENPKNDPMEFVPIAPFTPRLELADGELFHHLSSGEQQYINCIQAIVYHLSNLDSVHNGSVKGKVTYNCINIIQDEIELYFHPDFQRRFIKDLLQIVGNLNIRNIKGINFQFLTHSPFILSDIPSANVLRLHDGNILEDATPTFAGNIHELLINAFFMNDTMGDFARDQCNQILMFYEKVRSGNTDVNVELLEEYKVTRSKFKYIISQIGESVVKEILENHISYLDERLLGNLDNNLLRIEYKKMIDIYNKKIEELDAED